MNPKHLNLVKHKNGIYYLRGTILGRPIRESTRTKDYREACAIAVHRELDAMILATGARDYLNPLFSDCVKHYEKNGRYSLRSQGFVDKLHDWFGDYEIAEINQELIDEFVVRVFYGRGIKKSTIERYLNVFQAIRNHAVRNKLVSQDTLPFVKFQRVSRHDHRMTTVTKDMRDEIIIRATPDVSDVLVFLWYTGARVSCALSRKWTDRVDGSVRLYTYKGARSKLRQRRDYYVPEVEVLAGMLDRRFAAASGKYGFRDSDMIFNVSYSTVRNDFARVCRELGVKDFLLHDIRHCFGTYLAQDRLNLEAIANLMGHDSLESTRKYVNHAPNDLMRQMSGALADQNGSGAQAVR